MESKFQIVETLDNVSDYAVAGGRIYSIIDGRIYPSIPVLNEVIERADHASRKNMYGGLFGSYLRSYGNLLCFYFGTNSLGIASVCVDVTENNILYTSTTKDYKHPHLNIDITDTSQVYTVLYSEEESIFPLGLRNVSLPDSENLKISTIKRGGVSELEDGKYLFSKDKGANILNRIDSTGADIWEVQAVGQYQGATSQILHRNAILDILGVTDNTLWYSEYSSAIVGVDINSGLLVRRIETVNDGNSGGLTREIDGTVYPLHSFRLSPDKLKIIAVQYLIYAELNLQDVKPKFRAYPLDAELKKKGINLLVHHGMTISGGKVLLSNQVFRSELIFGIFETTNRTISSVISLNSDIDSKRIISSLFLNGQYYVYISDNAMGKLVVLELSDDTL